MKNTTVAFIIVLALSVIGIFFFTRGGIISGNTIDTPTGNSNNIQKVVISYRDYNYYPRTITVNAGQKVSISLDSSVAGCFRYFTINDLGLSKYLAKPSDTLEFTPIKKGTYRFACGMGMGYGDLIVK